MAVSMLRRGSRREFRLKRNTSIEFLFTPHLWFYRNSANCLFCDARTTSQCFRSGIESEIWRRENILIT